MTKIALLGLGTVGSGVYDIITSKSAFKSIEIKYVLINDINKKRKIPLKVLINDFDKIMSDSEISIVIEVMGTYELAYKYIKTSLENKKHVVTANKEVIAIHLEELTALSNTMGVSLFFEASVGGGVPIIDNLIEMTKINKITKIQGILNGTTNFILSKMQEKSLPFDEVLKQAQDLGFAEKDPTNDLDGSDMARKISILAQIGFGMKISMKDIDCSGIKNINERFINYAFRSRYVVRFIATATPSYICVEPVLIPFGDLLANVDNEYNCIVVDGTVVGKLSFCGKGAGDYPTAHAVSMDLLKILNGIKSPVFNFKEKFIKKNNWEDKMYLIAGKDLYITKPINREEMKKIDRSFYARIEEDKNEKI